MLTYDYQNEGIEFILKTGFNALIADQMGLGKTIQALLALRAEYQNRTPALILVKSATLWQWIGEYKKWCDPLPLGIYMIEGSKSWIPPGFQSYICSMDTFGRIISNENEQQKLLDFGFKLLIVDEVHSFKNSQSKRTQSLLQFIKKISHREIKREITLNCIMCGKSWKEETTIEVDLSSTIQHAKHYHHSNCPQCAARVSIAQDKAIVKEETGDKMGLIFLSGTPIKNRADEYFIPLNLLAPEQFPSLERFRRNFLEQDDSGKWSRIKPYMMENFKEKTSNFIIRRERNQVLKDLPKFHRIFTTLTIEDPRMKAAYNAEIDKLLEKDSEGKLSMSDITDNIMTMRKIIGMAKVKFAAEYIQEYLDDTEDDKIAVGIHHHAVRDSLIYELGLKINPVNIKAGSNIQWDVDTWKESKSRRVGVISMLGGGVGLNLQFCHHILNVERQWNSADEEQLEDRFNRIGQENPVTAEYLVVKGTIDAYFSNMVEEKRKICGETFGVNFNPMESESSMRDMVEWAMVNKL